MRQPAPTAPGRVGPERVIVGSNLPLAVLRRARLGVEIEALIFGGNLARLLGIAG